MPLYFDECPEVGYTYRDELPTVVVASDGPGYTDRYSMSLDSWRMYSWPLARDDEGRKAVDAFMESVVWMLNTFYVLDPRDGDVVAEAVGVANPGQTVYTLQQYPLDDGNLVLLLDGSPVPVDSIDTDAKTVTATNPATGGEVVTADYAGLTLVRLLAPFEWTQVSVNWYTATLSLTEVLSD